MIDITTRLMPANTKRRSGAKNKGIRFIVAHDTGNPNSTAMQNVSYYISSADHMSASAHAFVDDIAIVECIPETEKAWHVLYSVPADNASYGGDANDYALGIELCYFPKDIPRTRKAYANYTDYIAHLCSRHGIDPLKSLPGHFQLDPSRKTDPMNAFNLMGISYQSFLNDVKGKISKDIAPCRLGDMGKNIESIQDILRKNSCEVSIMSEGVYDIAMAQSVLYFQIMKGVEKKSDVAFLRGEKIGPSTLKALISNK